MKKLKHKQAVPKLNNKSVVIYYSLSGREMRFPTGVSVAAQAGEIMSTIGWDSKSKKLKLWSSSDHRKEHKVNELISKQATVDDFLTRANAIINEYYLRNIQIEPEELSSLLAQQQEKRISTANTGFFDYLDEFIIKKKKHFAARGNPISIKDYNSTRLLLRDFQAYKAVQIRVSDVSTIWMQELVEYMSLPHDRQIGEHNVSSKGEMANTTIKKRLDILAEFYGYLKERKIVSVYEVDTIKSYKKTIKKQPSHKETLDIGEIHKLYKFKFKNKQHEPIRDLFVFLCLTGLRYQDLADFDKRFIQKSKAGSGFIYKKAASKTGINYQIPLCRIVNDILAKYQYNLPIVSDQHGNRMIKDALRATNLFNSYTQIVDKKTKEFKKRYEAITLHKGRNSFITNLVDSVPLNELMKYTGHRKLTTLQGYIDVTRPVSMEYIRVFD